MRRVRRRRFLGASFIALCAGPLVGCALPGLPGQRAEKVYRIGVLTNRATDPAEAHLWEAFRLGLREHGWVEGENVKLEFRESEGDSARLPALAAELVRLQVDLILARSSIFVQPAKEATSTIPIVFVVHADPISTGHVASLAHPGGNVTGLANLQTTLGPKQLEILAAAVPTARRVAVLWDPDTPSHAPGLQALEEPARSIHIQLLPVPARNAAELEGAFARTIREGAQAVLVITSAVFFTERQRLGDLALAQRLPSMFGIKEAVEAGGLLSYAPSYADLYRRGAAYVDRIFRGANPADLPVEQATKFELVVNTNTARALGQVIPQAVLDQATEVL
jgi:putative ABC transport system substrate-binding protein